MSKAFIFWILMLIWLIGMVWYVYPNYYLVGGNLLQFILFGVLGWKVFGSPIKD